MVHAVPWHKTCALQQLCISDFRFWSETLPPDVKLAPSVQQKAFDLCCGAFWSMAERRRRHGVIQLRNTNPRAPFPNVLWSGGPTASFTSSDTGTSALVDSACSAQSWVTWWDTAAPEAEAPCRTRRDWRPSPPRSSASSPWSPGPASSLYLPDKQRGVHERTATHTHTHTHTRTNNTRASEMPSHKDTERVTKERWEPWAISSCRRASPRAENRSSLMRVSALRLYSRCWAFSCMADSVDSSMSVSLSTQRYIPRAWEKTHRQ